MPRWVSLHGFVMVKLSLILVLCLQTSWLMRVCFREKAIVILSFFLPFFRKKLSVRIYYHYQYYSD